MKKKLEQCRICANKKNCIYDKVPMPKYIGGDYCNYFLRTKRVCSCGRIPKIQDLKECQEYDNREVKIVNGRRYFVKCLCGLETKLQTTIDYAIQQWNEGKIKEEEFES